MENQKKNWHDKNYKKLLIIPAVLLLISIIYMISFYSSHEDFIYKDISLTGGTSITIYEKINQGDLENSLSLELDGLKTRKIYDLTTREQKALIIETKSEGNHTRQVLEDYLGYELTDENSSFEFTGPSLSKSFFNQLILAIVYAFTFMGVVVFLIFGKQNKLKILLVILSILPPLLFFGFNVISLQVSVFLSLAVLFFGLFVYLKYNMPSFAVIISAFADIFMTLALVNFLGIQMSSAGIVAFLMLIGYSVDTDILLTNRILKRREGTINERLFKSFQTGMTMTLTSLLAFSIALIIVSSFSPILSQIFTILVIGLGFDLINTWITNVSLIKWYVQNKK
jgi:preprotein translocase subunit SecF